MAHVRVVDWLAPARSATFWAVVAGVALSFVLPLQNLSIEQRRKVEAFEDGAASTIAIISPYLVMNLANLTALQAFFGASRDVTGEEFRLFNQSLDNLYPVPHRTGYATRVAAIDRAAFEQSMEMQVPGFTIRDWRPDGALGVAGARAEYFPVMLSADFDPSFLGFDLGSVEGVRSALVRARDSGRPAISELIQVPGQVAPRHAIVAPVYAGGGIPDIIPARRERLAGYVVLTARLGAGVEYVLAKGRQTDPHVLLFAADLPGATPGYVHVNPGGEPQTSANLESLPFREATARPFAHLHEIDFADRRFFVVLLPSMDLGLWRGFDLTDVATVVLGLAGTMLLAVFIRRREELSVTMQRSAMILDAMVRSAADAFVGTDEGGHVTDWSPQAESMFGWSAQEILGQDVVAQLIPERMAADARRVLAGFVRTGDDSLLNRVTEDVFRRRDGSEFPAQRMITAVQLDGHWRFYSFVRDLTQRRQTEAQLQQALKMEAIGQLTGGLAHDFNNLLGVVIGNLDLLKLHLGDNDRALQKADVALGAAERGATLTRSLLAVARRQPLDPRAQDVNSLIRNLEPLLVHSAGKKVVVQLELCPGEAMAKVDAGGMENSMLNLVVNARDAMSEGGSVTIRTRITSAGTEVSSTLKEGRYVVVSVADTGCGMPPEVVARAFEPFFTTKERGRGTGLGLPMVYGFARQSGGDARMYSEVGRGTTVNIYLPFTCDEGNVPVSIGEATAEAPRGSESILLVDDEAELRTLTAEWLGQLGYRVTAVDNPQAALGALAGVGVFDLLLSDVIMPGGMDGVALVGRAREARPALPALLISGFLDLQVGADLPCGVLQKPFRQAELGRAVRRALAGASAQPARQTAGGYP